MRQFEIRYLPLFEEDLADVIDYIAGSLKNPDAAGELLDTIEKALLERSQSPLSFEPYVSKKKRAKDYYRIYVKNFTIFYVVFEEDRVMEVRRILYSRRDIRNML